MAKSRKGNKARLFGKETPPRRVRDAKRRFCSGPGLNNSNMALDKEVHFSDAYGLELRFEFFNVFNHAQFITPSGLYNGGSFGVVTNANDPRIGQVAAKFRF